MAPIRRLLIANRGEIAVRVIRACRELDIEVVVVRVPSDPDRVPMQLADAAVDVPSYLDGVAIVATARDAGADAVHPGYGFLSEQPGFAEAVLGAGLTWVGPPPEAIRRMGDKVAARALASAAGVPVLSGSDGDDLSDDALVEQAERIGPPLLVKASGGGGGRGMREVDDLADLPAAIAAARAEAATAFGDPRVFLERRLGSVRHIEVQVLLDEHGGAVHLGERDGSLQRRHQKVVEEAPSPSVHDGLRRELGAAALAVAREVGYRGVGTVEFLVGEDGAWWFLEMNARLQVEHPVTEAVTGTDIVRAQLGIAAGDPLGSGLGELRMLGHAIEARVYAEDPAHGFLPSAGRLEALHLPHWPGVRIDTALEAGDAIGLGYDPLLAKVIAHDEDRASALARLRAALEEVRIVGITTNLGFLLDILGHPDVVAGRCDTSWIDTRWRPDVPALPAGARPTGDPNDPWTAFGDGHDVAGLSVAGRFAQYRGWSYVLGDDERDPADISPSQGSLVAPMPSNVTRVDVSVGDEVAVGQIALMLEAMKLQTAVVVPAAGVVRAVHVRAGDVVATGDVLIEVVPA